MPEAVLGWSWVLELVLSVLVVALGWFVRAMRQAFVHKGELAPIQDRVNRLEYQMQDMPNKNSFHELAMTVATASSETKVALEKVSGDVRELRAEVKGLRGEVERQGKTISMQNDHLLNRGD